MDVLQKDKNNRVGFFYPNEEIFDFEQRVKDGPSYSLSLNPDWKKYTIIGGHFIFGIHEILKAEEFRYIGVVRNPVDQYVSIYKQFLNMPGNYQNYALPGNEKSIEEMFKLQYTTNMQTWFISGLSLEEIKKDKERAYQTAIENTEKYFAGICPADRFDDGLFYFKHKIGINPVSYQLKNVASNPFEGEMPHSLVEKIEKLNDLDIRLYQHLAKKFNLEFSKIPGIETEVKVFKMKNYMKSLFNRS